MSESRFACGCVVIGDTTVITCAEHAAEGHPSLRPKADNTLPTPERPERPEPKDDDENDTAHKRGHR